MSQIETVYSVHLWSICCNTESFKPARNRTSNETSVRVLQPVSDWLLWLRESVFSLQTRNVNVVFITRCWVAGPVMALPVRKACSSPQRVIIVAVVVTGEVSLLKKTFLYVFFNPLAPYLHVNDGRKNEILIILRGFSLEPALAHSYFIMRSEWQR